MELKIGAQYTRAEVFISSLNFKKLSPKSDHGFSGESYRIKILPLFGPRDFSATKVNGATLGQTGGHG